MNIVAEMADIERRLRGLKAQRDVRIHQVNTLIESFSFPVTLSGGIGDQATFRVTIVCGGDPIVDVGTDGFAYGTTTFTGFIDSWSISGNTAICNVRLLKTTAPAASMTFIITALALNGLSATCVRLT